MDAIQLVCPVCRARQSPQHTCRRCQADLTLYVRAQASWDDAERSYQAACAAGDEQAAARVWHYLDWLHPRRAQALKSTVGLRFQ